MSFRMIVGDGFGDLFDERRLAGLGRRDDQAALTLADRRDQIEHSHRQVGIPGGQLQPFSRIDACELGELGYTRILIGVYPVHQFDTRELVRLSAATSVIRCHRSSRNLNALSQPEMLDQISWDKDIFWRRQIVALRVTKKAEPFFVYLKNTRSGLLILHYHSDQNPISSSCSSTDEKDINAPPDQSSTLPVEGAVLRLHLCISSAPCEAGRVSTHSGGVAVCAARTFLRTVSDHLRPSPGR